MTQIDPTKTAKEAARIEKTCFPEPWSEADISGVIECTDGIFRTERENGAAVGYALGRELSGEAELYRIAVLPEFRGWGIGKRLLSGFLAECGERGVKTVFLEVRSKNAAAEALYLSAGFVRIGTRKGYYGDDDAIIYSLSLG